MPDYNILSFCEDTNLYKTRKGIMGAERKGQGRINWDVYDRLVDELKAEFKAMRNKKKLIKEQERREKELKNNDCAANSPKQVYVYNMKGEQVDYFDNEFDFLIKYKMAKDTLKGYINAKVPYCNELILSYSVISDFSPYNESKSVMKAPKKVYVYKLDSGEEIGEFNSSVAASRAFGLGDKAASNALYLHNGIYRRRNLKFSYTKI